MTLKKIIPTVLLAVSFNANSNSNLYSMTLGELLEIKVASQDPANIQSAPAIVSSFSADELTRVGLRNFSDFIDFIPGVVVNQSFTGDNPIQMRGFSDPDNQKLLLLIDGIPYWMPSHGTLPFFAMPTDAIAKIEVIRGPGSVLYGSNASAGVISIESSENRKTAKWNAGELGYQNVGIQFADNLQDHAHVDFTFEHRDEDGYQAQVFNAFNYFDPSCGCFPANVDGTFLRQKSHTAMYTKVAVENFNLALQAHEHERSSSADGSLIANQIRTEKGYLVAAN